MADRYRGTLGVGVTARLASRILQHRTGAGSGFCRGCGLRRLVWAGRGDSSECIAHEKRLTMWRREWRIALNEQADPDWAGLFDGLA
ncbi:GIY-YIG nuclease family protein [Sphingomonas ginkgonis]|nr:GIY-YIG nuclease family protein [Sphingomonas ginkgonis]